MGYRVRQHNDSIIQAEFDSICPNLTEGNTCKAHDKKPRWCAWFPWTMEEFCGLDPNKMTPEGCGFQYVEDASSRKVKPLDFKNI